LQLFNLPAENLADYWRTETSVLNGTGICFSENLNLTAEGVQSWQG